jgi:glycosyltransferase involved in cell wall biosynthesis
VAGELTGGAARGAYWLHTGLRELGVDSVVYTNSQATHGDKSVVTINKSKADKAINIFRSQADGMVASLYRNREPSLFSSGMIGVDFTRSQAYRDADVVHLHWINAGLVNMKHLAKVDKPLVWTMRDMWPMTGGCHYAMECDKFTSGCGTCAHLGSKSKHDLSRILLKRKAKYLPKSMRMVGISDWLTEQARSSALFRDFDVRTIHNNVDRSEFFPVGKGVARELLGLRTDKKIVLTGSTSAKDPYKGFGKYLEALKELDPRDYHLCFFGKVEKSVADSLGFDYTAFGFLHDSISLRLVYAAADVFVAPSLMEAFGKTLTEAMACGTPVVCFDATGPKDIVSHRLDGFKAKPFEASGLAEGIRWVTQEADYAELCRNAIDKVERQFDCVVIAEQYMQLYREVLSEAAASQPSESQPAGTARQIS